MKKLEWGQTPWDSLTREELLREVQRMYCALSSLNDIVLGERDRNPDHPFWGKDGRGGRGVEMANQALSRLDEYDRESVYRSFFRYAYDLLFNEDSGVEIGFRWIVCPKCGVMIGNRRGASLGVACGNVGLTSGCDGVFRQIEWSDLEPVKENPNA